MTVKLSGRCFSAIPNKIGGWKITFRYLIYQTILRVPNLFCFLCEHHIIDQLRSKKNSLQKKK